MEEKNIVKKVCEELKINQSELLNMLSERETKR